MKHVFAFLGVRFDNKSAGVQKDEKGMVGCLESHSDKLEIHSLYLNHKLSKVMKNIERPENAELYQDDAYLMVRIFYFYFVFCIFYFLFCIFYFVFCIFGPKGSLTVDTLNPTVGKLYLSSRRSSTADLVFCWKRTLVSSLTGLASMKPRSNFIFFLVSF